MQELAWADLSLDLADGSPPALIGSGGFSKETVDGSVVSSESFTPNVQTGEIQQNGSQCSVQQSRPGFTEHGSSTIFDVFRAGEFDYYFFAYSLNDAEYRQGVWFWHATICSKGGTSPLGSFRLELASQGMGAVSDQLEPLFDHDCPTGTTESEVSSSVTLGISDPVTVTGTFNQYAREYLSCQSTPPYLSSRFLDDEMVPPEARRFAWWWAGCRTYPAGCSPINDYGSVTKQGSTLSMTWRTPSYQNELSYRLEVYAEFYCGESLCLEPRP